jgi:hypothetical protein
MKFSFFKALAAALWSGTGKKPIGNELAYLHRELMRKPKLQRVAQEHGNQRRMDAWHKSVAGGYDTKRKLVAAGKGRNTLAGIPA